MIEYNFIKEDLTNTEYERIKNIELIKNYIQQNTFCLKEKNNNIIFIPFGGTTKDLDSTYLLLIDVNIYYSRKLYFF